MISPVEFLSYDHRPADTPSQVSELEGPPFGEYLARAEKETGGSSPQRESDIAEENREAELSASEKTEDSKKAETAEEATADTKSRKNESPKDSDATEEAASREQKEQRASKDIKDKKNETLSSRAEFSEKKANTEKNQKSKNRQPGLSGDREAGAKDSESAVGFRAASETQTEKTPEKSNSSENLRESAESEDRDGLNQWVSGQELSEKGIKPGNTEAAENTGRRTAGGSRSDDAVAGESADLRKIRSGEDTREQSVKAELIDLRRRKQAKTEQVASQSAQKIDAGSIQESLKPEAQGRQDFVVIEATQAKSDGSMTRSDTGPAQAAADLSRALKEEGNGEIIKKAQFVLKDRDQGEIRLILKPEKLGEVRIRLNLSDNRHIAGRIIVENNSVREVFQENMEALNRAFRENGFQTAGLDVSVGQREGFSGRRRERDLDGLPVEKLTKFFEEQVPRVEDLIFGESRVNVYV